MKIITIFGGSGFIGTNIVKRLIKTGFIVRVITSNRETANRLKTIAGPEYLIIDYWCYQDFTKISSLIYNSFAVIYLVGILFEKKPNQFNLLHN